MEYSANINGINVSAYYSDESVREVRKREGYSMEYFDIVDENGLPTGKTVSREEAHQKGIPHRTSRSYPCRRRTAAVSDPRAGGGIGDQCKAGRPALCGDIQDPV